MSNTPEQEKGTATQQTRVWEMNFKVRICKKWNILPNFNCSQ